MTASLNEKHCSFSVPYGRRSGSLSYRFAPAGLDAAGHMLEVIVIEKYALQVVDDHVDCPVGSIPNLAVIGSPKKGHPFGCPFLFAGGIEHFNARVRWTLARCALPKTPPPYMWRWCPIHQKEPPPLLREPPPEPEELLLCRLVRVTFRYRNIS